MNEEIPPSPMHLISLSREPVRDLLCLLKPFPTSSLQYFSNTQQMPLGEINSTLDMQFIILVPCGVSTVCTFHSHPLSHRDFGVDKYDP